MDTHLCPITGKRYTPTESEPASPARVTRKQGRRSVTTLEPVSYEAAVSDPVLTPVDPKVMWPGIRDGSKHTSRCDTCGIPVSLPDDPRRKVAYCSDRCRHAHYRKKADRPERECDGCGHTFHPTRSDARYCSPKCRQAAYRRR